MRGTRKPFVRDQPCGPGNRQGALWLPFGDEDDGHGNVPDAGRASGTQSGTDPANGLALQQLQLLEQEDPVPLNAVTGLEGLRAADRILKERNAVGVVIGSTAEALWNRRVKDKDLKNRNDVDVLVLSQGFTLKEPFEGGIGLVASERQVLQVFYRGSVSPSEMPTEFWTNGNSAFLRAGIQYWGNQEPGLYLPGRDFLIILRNRL